MMAVLFVWLLFFWVVVRPHNAVPPPLWSRMSHAPCGVLMVFRCLFSAVCWGGCNSQVTSMIVASPGDQQPPGHSHSHDVLVLVRPFVDVHYYFFKFTNSTLSIKNLSFSIAVQSLFFPPPTSMLLFLITVHSQSYRPYHNLIKVLDLLCASRAKK